MKIKRSVFESICSQLSSTQLESGGLLGQHNNCIIAFCFDCSSSEKNYYHPNIPLFNQTLSKWSEKGIAFGGIVHSHPNGCNVLSENDINYIRKIAACAPMIEKLYFPLVTQNEKQTVFTSYIYSGGQLTHDLVTIVDD